MKRFWKNASITRAEQGFGVQLDARPLRTPARALLIVPRETLAQAIAAEWNAVGEDVDPRLLPLTGLANAAIDRMTPELANYHAALARYGDSDVVAYRADHPDALVARQAAQWDPVVDWAAEQYGARLTILQGIMHQPQPAAALARLEQRVARCDAFETAALHQLVTLTGSLLLGLMLAEGAITPEAAWAAGQLDELWQEEQWGADALAVAARAEKRAAFDAAWHYLTLLRG